MWKHKRIRKLLRKKLLMNDEQLSNWLRLNKIEESRNGYIEAVMKFFPYELRFLN